MFYLHYSLLEKGILSTFVVFICVNQIVIEHRLIYVTLRYPPIDIHLVIDTDSFISMSQLLFSLTINTFEIKLLCFDLYNIYTFENTKNNLYKIYLFKNKLCYFTVISVHE